MANCDIGYLMHAAHAATCYASPFGVFFRPPTERVPTRPFPFLLCLPPNLPSSSSLTDLLDHRGCEFGELQQIEGRQDLLEAGWVGEITDREVVLTLDLCGKRRRGAGGEGELGEGVE